MYTGLVCTLHMRVPVPVLVPYRTAAGHNGLRIMDRSLNACKTFQSKFDLWIGY